MGGRVTMMVPTALSPVPRVISFHVVVMVVGVSVSWERSVGGNSKARELWCHVETKTGMLSGNQV